MINLSKKIREKFFRCAWLCLCMCCRAKYTVHKLNLRVKVRRRINGRTDGRMNKRQRVIQRSGRRKNKRKFTYIKSNIARMWWNCVRSMTNNWLTDFTCMYCFDHESSSTWLSAECQFVLVSIMCLCMCVNVCVSNLACKRFSWQQSIKQK